MKNLKEMLHSRRISAVKVSQDESGGKNFFTVEGLTKNCVNVQEIRIPNNCNKVSMLSINISLPMMSLKIRHIDSDLPVDNVFFARVNLARLLSFFSEIVRM